ncbi:MAG TPA: putative DNA modification/repair radical SAM protein [Clostridia bacterium]|nr:putative DNA modification/repair radical SAM protein [Clostridia bacterium]
MDLFKKLEILSAAAKYDVSCSSSGSTRKNKPGGIGNAEKSGICHSWSADGRCISLLKILLTNQCMYNCTYCINRSSNDIPRASFTPDEVADLTINFYRRNYIEGLFLSSAVQKNPDHTMEQLIQVVKKLRDSYKFNGYIHLKAIPGADHLLIAEAGRLVDRMSVNIELPSSEGLRLLAPQKNREAIIKPMNFISSKILQNADDRKHYKRASSFVPAGQSTQLIVGATPDYDVNILKLSENLYKRFSLKRVYYSAYVPVNTHPNLPAVNNPPLLREHRLYQADWLLRYYGFSADELLDAGKPNFDTELDPKSDWAIRNIKLFPVEINKADYDMLLRIPGVGVQSAMRIVTARRVSQLSYEDLKKLGVVLKRAKYFITCRGKYYGEYGMNDFLIRQGLLIKKPEKVQKQLPWEQLSIYSYMNNKPLIEDSYSSVTGEL